MSHLRTFEKHVQKEAVLRNAALCLALDTDKIAQLVGANTDDRAF